MAKHSKIPDSAYLRSRSMFTDSGAVHHYAAPHLSADHARDAYRMGMNLQVVAAGLDLQHSQDYRRAQRINRLRHIAWALVVVAALLVTLTAAPLADWWQMTTDASGSSGR